MSIICMIPTGMFWFQDLTLFLLKVLEEARAEHEPEGLYNVHLLNFYITILLLQPQLIVQVY
jgi:hypothetical protein